MASRHTGEIVLADLDVGDRAFVFHHVVFQRGGPVVITDGPNADLALAPTTDDTVTVGGTGQGGHAVTVGVVYHKL